MVLMADHCFAPKNARCFLLLGLMFAGPSGAQVSGHSFTPVLAKAINAPSIAFYAPWDSASVASLHDHGTQLQVVVPAWISVTGPDHKVTIATDVAGRGVLASLRKRPKLWPMLQNALSGSWDGSGAAGLLRDKAATSEVLDQVEAEATKDRADGLVIDLESLPSGIQPDLLAFLATVRGRCRRHHWTLAVTAPVANRKWDLTTLGQAADRVILMAYDEHWQSGEAGPIASDQWFASAVGNALMQLRPSQTIVAIASYAYDWPAKGAATILSIEGAKALAVANATKPTFDPASGATHFNYMAGGVAHRVWMSDAPVVQRQLAIIASSHAAGTALWRLGTEDRAIWSAEMHR
jgi:spore germination protein YaaH